MSLLGGGSGLWSEAGHLRVLTRDVPSASFVVKVLLCVGVL